MTAADETKQAQKPQDTREKSTVQIKLPGGGTGTVSEAWAKRWPEDVTGSPEHKNTKK